MDIFKGQKLILQVDAVDVSDGKSNVATVKYKTGTEAEVVKIEKNTIWLKFPDGEVIANNGYDVLQAYKPANSKLHTKVIKGSGTPPKGIFSLMPEEADWYKNYGWTVTISLEELSLKTWICQDCYTELPEPNDTFQVECPGCKEPKTPIRVDSIIETNKVR